MRMIVMAICLCTSGALACQGPAPFSNRLTAEEFAAAGLGKLTPDEVSRLNALFAKYSDLRAANPVAPPVSPKNAAMPGAVVSKPAAAPTTKTEEKPASTGLLSTAKNVFKLPAAKPRVPVVESQIDGWFDGWRENTTWTLKDGTRWRADRHQSIATVKPVKDPAVKIYPAAVNGFWLELPDLDQKVRVVQLP